MRKLLIITAITCCHLTLLPPGASAVLPQRAGCELSVQLKEDSGFRLEYQRQLAAARRGSLGDSDDEEPRRYNIINSDYDYRSSNTLDPVSVTCLGCHDGSAAPGINNHSIGGWSYSGEAGGGSHPLGASYSAYSYRQYYRPINALSHKIVLVGGKIGCLSCHNPENPQRYHLVMSNDRSRLCLSCHIK